MQDPITLTGHQISRLIEHDKLTLGPTSPLSRIDKISHAKSKVDKALVADEERVAAFRTLANPSRLSRIVLPQLRQTGSFLFYAAAPDKDAPFVGFTRQSKKSDAGDDLWELVPGVNLADLLALAQQNAEEPSPSDDEFSFQLGLAGLFSLAAAIDTIRAGMAVDFLGRRFVDAPEYRREELEGFLKDGIIHHDPRWLVTAIDALLPLGVSNQISMSDGYAELLGMGLVQEAGRDRWWSTPALQSIVHQFASPLPAVAVTTVFSDENGRIDRRSHHVILAMGGPTHHFDMTPLIGNPAAKINIHRVASGKLRLNLEKAFTEPERI